jgi:hypothetical protein
MLPLTLIGTYEGIPFYADEVLTDDDVQARYLPAIVSEIAAAVALGLEPVKTVARGGRVFAFASNPENDPRFWNR